MSTQIDKLIADARRLWLEAGYDEGDWERFIKVVRADAWNDGAEDITLFVQNPIGPIPPNRYITEADRNGF